MDMNVTSQYSIATTWRPADSFVDSRDFARMTRAIEFIESEFERQPKLAEVAQTRRPVGVPLQSAVPSLDRADAQAVSGRGDEPRGGDALRDEPSVMDAAHAVGLSGGGRLHDLTVTLDAMTPGEIRAEGEGVAIRYGTADTPFGSAFLAETPRGLCRLAFLEPGGEREELEGCANSLPEARIRARRRARGRAGGRRSGEAVRRSLPLAVCGTNFQVQVWRALLELKPGATVTYSALARRLGKSKWCARRG